MIDFRFFAYYGSKFKAAAKLYPAPKFPTIIEPFAGSAGYSMAYSDRQVFLYDKDPIIFGVWDYLIKVSEREFRSLPDLGHGNSIDEYNLPQEAKWLIGFWINKSSAHPAKTWSGWSKTTPDRRVWGRVCRDRIASNLCKIRHWKCRQSDYNSIPHIKRSTCFVDPPYFNKGYAYRMHSKLINYTHLARWCKLIPGQVIVCENSGAHWLPFKPIGRINGSTGARFSKEAVWTNGINVL